jgi:hypothetical protein
MPRVVSTGMGRGVVSGVGMREPTQPHDAQSGGAEGEAE